MGKPPEYLLGKNLKKEPEINLDQVTMNRNLKIIDMWSINSC